ncbi:MAG: SDR family oxidoreductase [Rubrivivax sp.]|nr:SDR family oxidoreductase [Rubrivivax sp.]
MAERRRVLLLGASGMIGREILRAAHDAGSLDMLAASHRDRPGHLRVDYEALTTAEAWVAVLREHRVDAVVNCVGIWSGSAEDFERVHTTVPVALFGACGRLGLRIVHVSALGFRTDSPLPYVATKARAEQHLLGQAPSGVVVQPSLVFGPEGASTRFFLALAALPVHVDFGFARNLQPVHVREVATAVLAALRAADPPRSVECAGAHAVTVAEYLEALRAGMGLGPPLKLHLPPAWARVLFGAGELVGARFVNRQTWVLLQSGTRSEHANPAALPYERFATPAERHAVREMQLYAFARAGIAFLWLWTALVTWFAWPHGETLQWLASLWPALGTPFWLGASCLLDVAMGVAALAWPRRRLWLAQFWLTVAYSAGLALALPWTWSHPLGPLTKNLAVLATLLFLAMHEGRRGRG